MSHFLVDVLTSLLSGHEPRTGGTRETVRVGKR